MLSLRMFLEILGVYTNVYTVNYIQFQIPMNLSKVVIEHLYFLKKTKEKRKETLKREKKYILKRKSVVTFSCASKVQFNKICNVHTRKMTDSDLLPHSYLTPKNATQTSLINLTSSPNRFLASFPQFLRTIFQRPVSDGG